MDLSLDHSVILNNGVKIPILGLGTWTLRGKRAYQAVTWALEIGYKLIDTASFYGNEEDIGKAISDSKIDRDEIFITTKVWNDEQGYDDTLKAIDRSLKRLKLNHVDLYLIHWPVMAKRLDTWKAMEKILEMEKAKAVGVSNFTIKHLKELLESSSLIPAVNQVEFSPFLYQKELLEFCNEKGIKLEAYCPLTRGRKFNNPVIKSISEKYNKTPAQIMIRWGLQHGIIEIPKSGNKSHLFENANVFDFSLNSIDMEQLDSLDEGFRLVDDPLFYE